MMTDSLYSCEGDIHHTIKLPLASKLRISNSQNYYHLLPTSLKEIADISSPLTALKLALYFGGQKIYFSNSSVILDNLSIESVEKEELSHYLKGQQLDIPLANRALVCLLRELGFSHKEIIKLLRICLSTVNRYL